MLRLPRCPPLCRVCPGKVPAPGYSSPQKMKFSYPRVPLPSPHPVPDVLLLRSRCRDESFGGSRVGSHSSTFCRLAESLSVRNHLSVYARRPHVSQGISCPVPGRSINPSSEARKQFTNKFTKDAVQKASHKKKGFLIFPETILNK